MHFNRYSFLALAAAVLLFVPQTAAAQSLVPATHDGPVASAEGDGPYTMYRNGGITLTFNSDQSTPTAGGVSCGDSTNGTYTTENSYYRVFNLSDFAEITGPFAVSSVTSGVWVAEWFPSLPAAEATIRLYNLTNPPAGGVIAAGDLELVSEGTFEIDGFPGPEAQGFFAEVTFGDMPTFAADAMLAIEMFLPSGDPEVTGLEDYFDIRQGENSTAVEAPTYLASASCGITDPTDIGALGDFTSEWVMSVTGAISTAGEEGAVARSVTIGQNFPNPVVSGSTTIPFTLERGQDVSVTVYDALGREVVRVADAAFGEGAQSVDVDTSSLPNGVYFYRIATEGQTHTQKMVVVQ